MLLFFVSLLAACNSKVMKAERSQEILKNEEFDKQIQIQELPSEPKPNESGLYVKLPGPLPVPRPAPTPKPIQAKKTKIGKAKGDLPVPPLPPAPALLPQPMPHEPAIEDAEGFESRRPKKDPYRIGEKVILDVSYFGVSAGDMTLEVRPFVNANGRKSYHFAGTAVSTSVFAMFYAVDDWFETFLDYETLTPSSYALHVKESKQLRETRCLFDWSKMQATYWDKKINAEQKVEERKFEWEIPGYAQNIFTALYYLRNFQLKVGKKFAFYVAHEKENLLVTGEVIRKEKLSTAIGELDTVVVKPKIELNGVFKPVGDIFVWLTDDDRKLVVRIESKIKIGTIVAAVKSLQRGQE